MCKAIVAAADEAIAAIDAREIAVAASIKNADEAPGGCTHSFAVLLLLPWPCIIRGPATADWALVVEGCAQTAGVRLPVAMIRARLAGRHDLQGMCSCEAGKPRDRRAPCRNRITQVLCFTIEEIASHRSCASQL